MKRILTCLCLFVALPYVQGQAIDLSRPPSAPQLLSLPGINTSMSERDFALSPDGRELFYTLQSPKGMFQTIIYRKRGDDGHWSPPRVASFAGHYSDLEPAFAPDGNKLYFSSNRPVDTGDVKDFDIWCVVRKKDGGWGEPYNLGKPVNGDANEYYPAITRSGNLYFTAAYPSAVGKEDIYVCKFDQDRFLAPQPLDSAINSKNYEFNAFVSPDEDYIIFSSYGRDDDLGGGDLYMSSKDAAGTWLPAWHLAVNSASLDYCPFVSFDKKSFFFTSEKSELKSNYRIATSYVDLQQLVASPLNGGGNIYWVSFESLKK